MKLIKVAAACLNQTPFAWDSNLANIREAIRRARAEEVTVLCLPELCITGYGCEDAFFAPGLQEQAFAALEELLPEIRRGAPPEDSLMSASSVRFTSFSDMAPTRSRASPSVAARASTADSRCPAGALAPIRAHFTKKRYAPHRGDCVASSSARISTL